MNTAEIKLDILKKIDGLNPHQLKEAYGLFQNYINSTKDEWAELNADIKQKIELGLREADAGQLTPLKEATGKLRRKYGLNG